MMKISGLALVASLIAGAAQAQPYGELYWKTRGNAATPPGSFLGTTDRQPLRIGVDGRVLVRLEPGGSAGIPNVILGYDSVAEAGISGAAVGGGSRNVVTDDYAYVASGVENQAIDHYAAVLSGLRNVASGDYAVVVGGRENEAAGYGAVVLGGSVNRADGASAVAGGSGSSASGANSFAAGTNARADHAGAFVWADSQSRDPVASTADHQFVVRAGGGVWLGAGSTVDLPPGVFLGTSTGAHLSAGGTWTNASDAALKRDFQPVDGAAVLAAVARLPITSWRYRAEDSRHLGPTAQDFRAAFGLGADARSIATVDADGVALAAIQELERRTRQVEALTREVRELREQMNALREELGR